MNSSTFSEYYHVISSTFSDYYQVSSAQSPDPLPMQDIADSPAFTFNVSCRLSKVRSPPTRVRKGFKIRLALYVLDDDDDDDAVTTPVRESALVSSYEVVGTAVGNFTSLQNYHVSNLATATAGFQDDAGHITLK